MSAADASRASLRVAIERLLVVGDADSADSSASSRLFSFVPLEGGASGERRPGSSEPGAVLGGGASVPASAPFALPADRLQTTVAFAGFAGVAPLPPVPDARKEAAARAAHRSNLIAAAAYGGELEKQGQ